YHSGPPDAAWSHWLEEGLATFFETDDKVSGAKKEPLIRSAARREGLTLAGLLQGADPRESGFSAASHSLVAFLHTDFRADHIRRYVEEERRPGPVAPGTFERIFGADVERAWKDFLKQ
ncbi:MAG TPA: hypothetical protein VJU16_01105, partial [Planctomycetota bacterium]|nr:hypothetical protein [Planctomycetota bacterium]